MSLIEIVLAVVLIVLVVLQNKGTDLGGFLGGDSGGGSGPFRTRRGMEATLHTVTIYFSIAFFIITVLTFIAVGQS
ncbi:MAG: preprotein translocase subunit SecG [Anaerolineales bacterium]|nr:preprotein translocase subunit SecG [Anaerolineales bacterium]MCB8953693.1 preprotein translocase subunit SecG [Ardenticatenales bacterium]